MVAYQDLFKDRRPLNDFRASISDNVVRKKDSSAAELPLHVFEWSEGDQQGRETQSLRSVEALQTQNSAIVRVIFAPQDKPNADVGGGLSELFDRCEIPSAFIEEGLQDVSQSFAARKHSDGSTFVWFHFLCKDVALLDGRVVHNPGNNDHGYDQSIHCARSQNLSQANFSWLKTGIVLRVSEAQGTPSAPSRSTSASSSSTLTCATPRSQVELFCFGAPIGLRDRFQSLKNSASCDELLHDPYMLLEIMLSELYKVIDRTGWRISDAFGNIETATLAIASTPGRVTKLDSALDFAGLHNLSKHCIHLRENCESALATLGDLREHHKSVIGDNPNEMQESTKQALKYRKTLFQSTQRRLASLDARMANIMELSFHIVAQGDSRLMQSESQSMKTIAIMTLLFMPLSTVATIFGTQFMRLQEDDHFHIAVSQDFWLLWVIAVPLTIIVMAFWRVWYVDAKGRLIDEIPRGTKRYMGWRTLPQKIRIHDRVQHVGREMVARDVGGKV